MEKVDHNNLWARVQKDAKDAGTSASEEVYLVVVGAEKSGKTTLVQRFINPKGELGNFKETLALEYTYAKPKAKHSVVNFWELGGGRRTPAILDTCCLTPDTMPWSTIVVCVDLSKPETVFDDLSFWMEELRQVVSKQSARLDPNSKQAQILKKKASRILPEGHEDAAALKPIGVNVVVAATKWDVFKTRDPEHLRAMASMLRFAAHYYGAHLVYTSEHDSHCQTRSVLYKCLFGTLPAGSSLRTVTDALQPAAVCPGEDTLKSIGLPRDVNAAQVAADQQPLRFWEGPSLSVFGKNQTSGDKSLLDKDIVYDEEIMAAVGRQEEELERYRVMWDVRQREDQERLAKKHSQHTRNVR